MDTQVCDSNFALKLGGKCALPPVVLGAKVCKLLIKEAWQMEMYFELILIKIVNKRSLGDCPCQVTTSFVRKPCWYLAENVRRPSHIVGSNCGVTTIPNLCLISLGQDDLGHPRSFKSFRLPSGKLTYLCKITIFHE